MGTVVPPKQILIFALDLRAAYRIATTRLGLHPDQWVYVCRPEQLWGRRGCRYYLDASFWSRHDRSGILDESHWLGLVEASLDELRAMRRDD